MRRREHQTLPYAALSDDDLRTGVNVVLTCAIAAEGFAAASRLSNTTIAGISAIGLFLCLLVSIVFGVAAIS